MIMVPSNDRPRSSLRTPALRVHALNVSHANRARGRLRGEGHMAADIAIVIRAAHAETAGRHSAVPDHLSGGSASGDEGKKDGGEDGAHAGTRHGNLDLRKAAKVTIT